MNLIYMYIATSKLMTRQLQKSVYKLDMGGSIIRAVHNIITCLVLVYSFE